MLMGMSTVWAFGETKDIQGLSDPEVDGWDELTERNVFSIHDKTARPATTVPLNIFHEINTEGEKLEEPMSQKDFGVKVDC